MNKFLVILLIITVVRNITIIVSANILNEEELWKSFKVKFDRKYDGLTEANARYTIFKDNLARIESHNEKYIAGMSSYKLGVNQFADLSHEEFVSMLKYNNSRIFYNEGNQDGLKYSSRHGSIPSEVDWRKVGAVTPVKNQENCGSCWSFSATGSLEGQYFLKTNKLVSLSEQNLMDCSYQYGNHGCDGGLMEDAFKYVRDFGIMSEDSYPYDAIDTSCKFNASQSIFRISSYVKIESGNELKLQSAVAHIGPVSIAVDALDFALYAEGIFDDDKCCNTETCLSHGVLAVGYGTSEDGMDYWLVKNSWAETWGENGYIRMSRNKDNQCGVATSPIYPVL